MIALTGEEMKQLDISAIDSGIITGVQLMGNAANAVLEEILKHYDEPSCFIACGPGNNGGDGFALARYLMDKGLKVHLFFIGDIGKMSHEAQYYYGLMLGMNQGENELLNLIDDIKEVEEKLVDVDVIVDGLFGFNCSRPIDGIYKELIILLNNSKKEIISIDMPSGIHSDNGQVLGEAIKASNTITFTLPKIGLFLYPGALYIGVIIVKDIGIPEYLINRIDYEYELLDDSYLKLMPKRHMISHKGTYGKVGIIAGSRSMCGAAILAAKAAYRTGCGLVHIITEAGNEQAIFASVPEAIITTYHKDVHFQEDLENIKYLIEGLDAVLVGPGITRDQYAKSLVDMVMSTSEKKIVIDADGLNIISENMDLLEKNQEDLVVTPHIGEMSRMTGYTGDEILNHTVEFTKAFSDRYQLVTVLKSARTIISVANKTFVNVLGHSGMATAGSGDVLSGMIVSLMGQGCKASLAAVLGVYLHSKASHVILERTNPYSMMASDIIEGINKAL